MSDKKYTPKEVAIMILKKAEELYKGSELAKVEDPLNSVAGDRIKRAVTYKERGDAVNHGIAVEGAKESHKERLQGIKEAPKPNLEKAQIVTGPGHKKGPGKVLANLPTDKPSSPSGKLHSAGPENHDPHGAGTPWDHKRIELSDKRYEAEKKVKAAHKNFIDPLSLAEYQKHAMFKKPHQMTAPKGKKHEENLKNYLQAHQEFKQHHENETNHMRSAHPDYRMSKSEWLAKAGPMSEPIGVHTAGKNMKASNPNKQLLGESSGMGASVRGEGGKIDIPRAKREAKQSLAAQQAMPKPNLGKSDMSPPPAPPTSPPTPAQAPMPANPPAPPTMNQQIGNPFGKSEEKGHIKLAKFVGRMEAKRGKPMDKAETGHEKGVGTKPNPSYREGQSVGGVNVRAGNMGEAKKQSVGRQMERSKIKPKLPE